MSLDLEALAAEVGASTGLAAVDEMYEDAARIRNIMESRRKLMDAQVASDAIKSKLCDKIQGMKRAVPKLAQRISALEDDDPEMFKYVRNLEFINQGIWCPKCNVQKCVGNRPAPKLDTVAEAHNNIHLDYLKREYERIDKNFRFALGDIQTLKGQFEDKITQLTTALTIMQDQLASANERASAAGIDLKERPRAPAPGSRVGGTVKKEDLPPRPVFDLDRLIEEKFGTCGGMSSSDLLGA